MAVVVARTVCKTLIDSQLADTMLFEDVVVKLFTNDIIPTPESVAADFTEVADSWYVSATTDFVAAYWNDDGVTESSGGLVQWVYATGPDTTTVLGYYLIGSAGGFLGAERFAEPQYMTVVGDELSFVPRLTLKSDN